MLVLSRKPDEEIVIAGTVTVKVLRVQGHRVYIGIEAPQEVRIRRAEIPPPPEQDHCEEHLPAEQPVCATSA